jgi:CPA1 family monovalent cation:H+ antiporter
LVDTVHSLLAVATVLLVVSVLVPAAERFRLPHTVLLAMAGLAMGFAGSWLSALGPGAGLSRDVWTALESLQVGADSYLPLFLPPLLMTAGLTIDVRRLLDELSAVLLLAVVAVLVCIAAVGGVVHLATGVDLVACLLLGAVVSTTDPAAVIGIFRDVGAPRRLSILAEGESLLNDAVAIAAFGLFLGMLGAQTSADPSLAGVGDPLAAVGTFVREFFGGLLFGFALARAAVLVLPRLGESDAAVASVTVSLAYAGFILSDHYLHCSGVVCVVMTALTLAAYGPTHLHPRRWSALRQLWTQLEFWASSLIFVLASMLAATVLPRLGWMDARVLLAVAGGAFAARAFVVFGMLPALEWLRLVQPVDGRYKVILVWGGLRGAVTIVLAMVAAADPRLAEGTGDFVALSATVFVLFTLFFNATTLRFVMHGLGLDRLSALDLAMRDRVIALSRVAVAGHLEKMGKRAPATPGGAAGGASENGVAEGAASAAPELALDLDQRVQIGLLTLAIREKEMVLELFDQQILSRRMVAMLVSDSDRLIDLVRDRGVVGHDRWLQDTSRPDRIFRFALFLQRRLGLERPLAQALADRVEGILIVKGVLEELEAVDLRSIADLIGDDAAERLAEVFATRVAAVENAFRALSLQYAGYVEAIEARQLERAAIRLEASEYERRLREGSISREVYDDLLEELDERRGVAVGRPALHLGLELAEMIGRVPLFAGLDEAAIAELGSCLRAEVTLPGERIVSVGDPAGTMYFVAAGSLTVHAPRRRETIGEGDFFGEMGLLRSQPRNADVVADGYCHLLVLSKKDFDRVLQRRPEVRAAIEAVASLRDSLHATDGKPSAA